MRRKFSYLLMLVFFISSCKKESVDLGVTKLNSGTSYDLRGIFQDGAGRLFACGGDQYFKGIILRSEDGGVHWMQVQDTMPKQNYFIREDESHQLYCSGYDGYIYRSIDGGEHWYLFRNPEYAPFIDMAFPSANHMVAAIGFGFEKGYLRYSADNGSTWKVDTFIGGAHCLHFVNEQIGYAGIYGGIEKTTDGGAHWSPLPVSGDFFIHLYFFDEKHGVAIGYFGSVMETNDAGAHWKRIYKGRSGAIFNAAAFDKNGEGYIVGDHGLLLQSKDYGQTWKEAITFSDETLFAVFCSKEKVYISGTNGSIFSFER
jgi:photosystem II stability/assembly factor-like uncharacterized protein